MELSDNELVTMLLCSDIALNESGLHPLTDAAYSCLAKALFKSNLEPVNLFSMSENSIYDLVNQNKELFSKLKIMDFETRIPALLKRYTQLYIQLSKLQNEKYPDLEHNSYLQKIEEQYNHLLEQFNIAKQKRRKFPPFFLYLRCF